MYTPLQGFSKRPFKTSLTRQKEYKGQSGVQWFSILIPQPVRVASVTDKCAVKYVYSQKLLRKAFGPTQLGYGGLVLGFFATVLTAAYLLQKWSKEMQK